MNAATRNRLAGACLAIVTGLAGATAVASAAAATPSPGPTPGGASRPRPGAVAPPTVASPGSPARTQPGAAGGDPKLGSDACSTVLGRAKSSSASKQVVCASSIGKSFKKGIKVKKPMAAPADIAGETDMMAWCAAAGHIGIEFFYRDQACIGEEALFSIYDVIDGVPTLTGTVTYDADTASTTFDDELLWEQDEVVVPVAATGTGVGATLSVSASCLGSCVAGSPVGDPVEPYPQEPSVIWAMTSNLSLAGQAGGVLYSGALISLTVSTATATPASVQISQAGTVRCDTILPADADPNDPDLIHSDDTTDPPPPGCVVPQGVPILHYSAAAGSPVQEVAQHIADAQAAGQPGAPGTPALQRLMSKAAADKNRGIVCPPSFPRGTGQQCDEYPFASTYQGGTGADPRALDATQNRSAGGTLSQFYRKSRLLDTDPFYVQIDDTQSQGDPITQGSSGNAGTTSGGSSAAVGGSEPAEIFVRDNQGLVHEQDGNASGGWSSFSAGTEPAGTTVASDPSVVIDGSGTEWMFVRGADGELYSRHTRGGSWQSWEDLGGTIEGRPHAIVDDQGILRVFVRASSGAVEQDDQQIGLGSWSGLVSTGFIAASDPVPMVDLTGIIRVYTTAASTTHLWEYYLRPAPGSVWTWFDMGCCLIGTPMPVVDQSNTVHVYVKGTNNSVFETRLLQPGSPYWTGFVYFNVATSGDIYAYVEPNGRLDVAITYSADGTLRCASLTSTWGPWVNLGTGTTNPIAMTDGTNGLVIFLRLSGNALGDDTENTALVWAGVTAHPGLTLGT